MSQERLIHLECTICKHLNYQSKRNKKSATANNRKRLEFQKFCKHCKAKTLHRETK